MPSLQANIDEYKESFKQKVPEAIQETMRGATQQLIDKNIKNSALKIGDQIASFSMLNANNKAIHIDEVLNKYKYVILSFYRGSWCPYCNMELRQLQKILPELKILQTQLLALSPQNPDDSLSLKEKEHLDFEVLCDKNNALARKFGIVFTLDDSLKPIYEDFGIDILQSNKNGTFDLPLPATFVINNNHEVIYAFVDEDYTHRCEPKEILHVIKEDLKNSH